jgi:O-antigen/teichoic acid export membrane protein
MDPAREAVAVARGAGANLIGMLARLLRPLFLFAAASLYGSTTFGVYMLAWAFVDVGAKAGTFGLDKGLMRLLPIAQSALERERVLAAAVRGTALGASALTLALVAAAPTLARFYHLPELHQVVAIVAPAVAASALVTTLTSALMAVHVLRGQVLVKGLGDPLLLLVFAVAFRFVFGRAPWVLALAHGAAQAALVVVALFVYGRTFSLSRTLLAPAGPAARADLWRFSLPMWASDGLAVVQSRADLLVLARLLPQPALVGMYAVAKQIANVVSVVRFAFDPIFWPRVARLSRSGDRAGLSASYRLVARWVALLALPLALVLGFYGPDIGRLVGRDYRGPLAVFVLLVIGQLANAVFGLAGHLMAMAGRPRVVVLGYAGGALVTVALAALLVPPLGLAGAAAASACAYLGVMGYQVVQTWRVHRVSPLSRGLGKLLVAAAAMAVVLGLGGGRGVLPGVLTISIGLGLYLIVQAVLGFEPEDRELFDGVRRRLWREAAS